jgi:hypothetical protein
MLKRATITITALATLIAVPALFGDAASAATYKPVTCHSGDILEGTYGNVTIPSGNYCLILRSTIYGNVTAQSGATQLGIDNSTITGNINVSGITDNGWICGSHIGGNVNISGSAYNPDTVYSPGYWDIGFADPNYCGNTSFDPTPGNTITGSLTFTNNQSGANIANNNIGNNLGCSGNTPPPTGGNNHVSGNATGQCAALAV